MCAINGITREDVSAITAMNKAVHHRGPDGTGSFTAPGITLGHNRLAIIDLSERAAQPMHDASGRYTIVFNGEIYNYQDLKKELSSYPYRSQSDTEVILAAYLAWGTEAFGKLNGIFGLAIWDAKENILVLARDSVGVKPLYYAIHEGALVFSSEIKGLLAAGVPSTLNKEALPHYFRLLHVPEPLTLFAGVHKLRKGHTLTYKGGEYTTAPYRVAFSAEAPRSYAEAVREVRGAVDSAVRRQLVSDRPVGLFLSGGVDSSIILSCAAKAHPHIDTFSIGFVLGEGEQAEKFNRDSELARETAARFGATHHEFHITSDDALALFEETIRHLDEPVANATALAQLYLARQTKPTATVVLSGDGGDELFGGYERYRMAHGAALLAPFVPTEKMRLTGVDRFAQLMFQKEADVARVLIDAGTLAATKDRFSNEFAESNSIAEALMRADENHWLVDDALMRADKAAMATAVEARVPLLDLQVRALAHVLPRSYKVTPFTTKRILKDAFREELSELLREPKRGWFPPGAKWLRHPGFEAFAEQAFSGSYGGEVAALLNLEELRSMWKHHKEGKAYHYQLLFAALALLTWAETFRVKV